MRCYISKVCEVIYREDPYPYTFTINFKGKKEEMEKMKKKMEKKMKELIPFTMCMSKEGKKR